MGMGGGRVGEESGGGGDPGEEEGNKVKGISVAQRRKGGRRMKKKRGEDLQLSVINTLWSRCFFFF